MENESRGGGGGAKIKPQFRDARLRYDIRCTMYDLL